MKHYQSLKADHHSVMYKIRWRGLSTTTVYNILHWWLCLWNMFQLNTLQRTRDADLRF